MNVFDLSAKIAMDINGYLKGMDTAKAMTISTMSVIGGALGQFMDQSIEVGKKFDSSMSQVAATMGDKADKTVQYGGQMVKASQALRDFALETGRTTAFTASECAEALNYMALAGYDAGTSMEMLPNVLNLAAAGNMDLARASDMVTDTQTAFGISGQRVTQMIDEMAKASSTGNTSVEQLGDAFLTVGGLAQELNGGMITLKDGTQASVDGVQELEIALTAMANAGIKGSEAGTHMRNMLLKLSSPTKEGADEMERLGVKVFDADGHMRSLQDIMGDLNGSLSTLTQEEKVKAISNLFNTRDLASAEALLNAVGADWNAIGEEILNAKGAADKMAKTQLDNLAGDTKLFESALEGLQIALSDGATPALREMTQFGTDAITELTNVFKDLPPEAQTAISLIADFGGKALSMAPQVLGMAGNIAMMNVSMQTAGVSAAGLAVAMGPLLVAIAAVTAAVAGGIYVYKEYTEYIEGAAAAEAEFANQVGVERDIYAETHEQVMKLVDGENDYLTTSDRIAQLESMRTQVANDRIDAGNRLNEAQEKARQNAIELEAAEAKLEETSRYYTSGMNEQQIEVDKLRTKQEELDKAVDDARTTYQLANLDVDEMDQAIIELQQEEENAKIVQDALTGSIEETSAAYQLFGHDVHESMQDAASKVVASVLEMQDALSGSVSSISNWFDAVEQQEAQSAETMKANLRAQIDQVKNWEKDLAYLGDLGINKEFLTYLANMGPKGYQYVLAMKEDVLSGGQDTVDEWNALYEEKLDLETGVNNEAEDIYNAIAVMEAGGVNHLEAMAKAFNLQGENVGQGVTLGFINKLNDAVTDIKEAGQADGEAAIDGLEDGTDSHSPSKAAMTVGKNVGLGITQGIKQQESAVKAAGIALGKAAVSGITGQQGAVSTFGATIGRAVVSGINSYQSAVSGAGASLARSALNGANSVNLQGNGYNIGMYFVLGMRNGIYDYSHAALSAAQSVAYNMMNSVRSIMRIGSPSKVAEYFGEMWDAGLEGGILSNAEAPIVASREIAQGVVDETSRNLVTPSYDYDYGQNVVSADNTAGSDMNAAPFNATINVYGAEGQDIRQLAILISQEMATMLQEGRAVWA